MVMTEEVKDIAETAVEGQGDVQKQAASGQPQEGKTSPKPSQGDTDQFAKRADETIEAWAERLRGEVNWRDRQMGRQYRQIKERDDKLGRLTELEAENNRLRELAQAGTRTQPSANSGQVEPTPPAPSPQPRVMASQPTSAPANVMAEARMQVKVEELSAKLQENPEWTAVHANFTRIGGIDPNVVSDLLDTDDPVHVMMTLGRDMNRYQQILDLPEGRRRAALIKIGMEPGQKPKEEPKPRLSTAPQPLGGLPSGGSPPPETIADDIYDTKYNYKPGEYNSTEEAQNRANDAAWFAARRRQKAESQGRVWSPGRPSGR
jgi:hypothetical protein